MSNEQATTWNQLFVFYSEATWDRVFRFSVSLCKDESEAEDLTQQTLLKSLQALPTFFKNNYSAETADDAHAVATRQGLPELQSHLLNWMLKICKNIFLDSRNRAHRKLQHTSLDTWAEEHLSSETGSSNEPFLSSSAQSNSTSLLDAEKSFFIEALDDEWKSRFETLNAKQRSIIYLIAEDYSYKEIAQLLEIPIGTVMSTLSRALAKLKKAAES